jgi:DNA polymerase-3 subunit gamma/tau
MYVFNLHSMTFIPWHLKYRPNTLEQIVGQPLIARTLTNLVVSNKLAGAFLFSGSRGTGKTSTARILAKSLNCQKDKKSTINPCGECHSCRSIDNGSSIDVIEIDAASNNGVDEIRSLIAQSSLVAVGGRYRVFILDEIQMLSRAGQNAFLKTLEEPNSNVLFILATTEPYKLLDTIVSRCLHLRFSRLSLVDITKRLASIAEKENIQITDEAIDAIARSSQGGMRDSIQLLYQLSALQENIDVGKVYRAIGDIPPTLLQAIVEAVLNKQIHSLLTLTEQLNERGIEARKVFNSILATWKDLLAIILTSDRKPLIEGELYRSSSLSWTVLQSLAKQLDVETVIDGFQQLEAAQKRIDVSSNSHLWLQTTLLSLAI